MARLLPRGLLGRTVIGSALAAIVVLLGAWWWVRTVAYDDQLASTRELARSQVQQILNQTLLGVRLAGDYGPLPYELAAADCLVVSSSSDLQPFEQSGCFMPAPGDGEAEALYLPFVARFPDQAGSPLSGKTLEAISGTIGASQVDDRDGLPGGVPATARYRVYVFVTTASAEAARSRVDTALLVMLPLGVVLVAGVAGFAVSRSLRTVRRITRNTNDVTAKDPGQRVAVPDTGDAIEELALTINGTLDRLEVALREQRRFVSDASHELRSPLAALRFGLEVAQHHPDSAPTDEVLASAVASADRLDRLLEDLLGLARLDAGSLPRLETVDAGRLLRDAVSDVAPRPGIARHVDLSVADSVSMTLPPGLLRRAVVNVLSNAQRYARSRVDVTVSGTAVGLAIMITDDGPGIPVGERERVFGRFVRLDDARTRMSGGTGLGLAIARESMRSFGGDIRVLGGVTGATVQITVPLESTDPI